MPQYRFLILNGPNLGRLGERQPEIYGRDGMSKLPELLTGLMGPVAAEVECVHRQSNSEGGMIDLLEKARDDKLDGVVLNAGAYTHTSLALADCLAWIGLPCVEVHLSNIWARTDEPLRQKSYIGQRCVGVIAGFGLMSYALAVQALHQRLARSA